MIKQGDQCGLRMKCIIIAKIAYLYPVTAWPIPVGSCPKIRHTRAKTDVAMSNRTDGSAPGIMQQGRLFELHGSG